MAYRININNEPFHLDVEEIGIQKFRVRGSGDEEVVEAFSSSLSHYTILIDDRSYDVYLSNGNSQAFIVVNGKYFQLGLDRNGDKATKNRPKKKRLGPAEIKARMPGKVVKVLVQLGDVVKKNQPLMVIEAMKMENEICAPNNGTVKEIHVKGGQSVENAQKLITVIAV